MKRSQSIRLVLLGGLSAGALATYAAAAQAPRVTPENYFTNEDFIPGAGYYHAPFRAFFPQPYNYYDPARRLYFYGGQWNANPHRSIVNISAPTPEAARAAESMRTDLARTHVVPVPMPRSGFGSTSRSHTIRS